MQEDHTEFSLLKYRTKDCANVIDFPCYLHYNNKRKILIIRNVSHQIQEQSLPIIFIGSKIDQIAA